MTCKRTASAVSCSSWSWPKIALGWHASLFNLLPVDGGEEVLERPCERRRRELIENPPAYKLTSHDLRTMCQPDGWFDRVQRNDTHFYCADQFGEPIGDYGEILGDSVEERKNPAINCSELLSFVFILWAVIRNFNKIFPYFRLCSGSGFIAAK